MSSPERSCILSEARDLAAKGAIIMAQRFSSDRVELRVPPAMKRITASWKPEAGKGSPAIGRAKS